MNLAQYQQAFDRLAPTLPPSARIARTESLNSFQQSGFPQKKLEDWRYTDLSALNSKSFSLAPSTAPDLSAYRLPDASFQPCVNGGNGVLSALTGNDAISQLNAAFARDGLVVHLQARQRPAQAFHLLTFCQSPLPVMAHLRHRIRLEAETEAVVILQHAGRGEYFTTQVTEIELGANSQLTLYRLQDESPASYHLAQTHATLARNSRLKVVTVDLGGSLSRHDLNVSLNEPGAEAYLHGLYAPAGRAHVDNHTRIDHRAEHCTSREYFRGLAFDQSRAVFNGKIVVHADAQKTDSEQRVANLLLSKSAEINAKPELEIYADDVKCAHGATFGQLDEDAIFYLRSRGLDQESARALLTYAFAQEVLDKIEHEELRRRIIGRFAGRLPQSELIAGMTSGRGEQ